MGRLCEEFPGFLPSQLWHEWLQLPLGFLEQVVEYRAYARAKALVDNADTAEAIRRLPKSDMVTLVREIEFRIVEDDSTRA